MVVGLVGPDAVLLKVVGRLLCFSFYPLSYFCFFLAFRPWSGVFLPGPLVVGMTDG